MTTTPDRQLSRGGGLDSRLGRIALLVAGVAVVAGAGATIAAYRRDLGQARDRIAGGSTVARTRCGPIEFAEAGSGPPVLVVHGAGGGFDQGMTFGAPLAAQGLRVIAMSRFGYLRTPLPADASAAAQADAHACLLDALGIGRAAIVGASAGAPSALQFALRHADRCSALVLVVPAAYVPRPGGAPPVTTPRWTQTLFDTALRSDFLFWAASLAARETVLRAILATPPEVVAQATPAEQARVAGMIDRILPVAPRRLGLLNDARVTSTETRVALERIAAPTLAISAADDLFGADARDQRRRRPVRHLRRRTLYRGADSGARFVGYRSGGHVWVGHQDELVAEIVAFLR